MHAGLFTIMRMAAAILLRHMIITAYDSLRCRRHIQQRLNVHFLYIHCLVWNTAVQCQCELTEKSSINLLLHFLEPIVYVASHVFMRISDHSHHKFCRLSFS